MAQDGEIDLIEVKARYSVRDIDLVDRRELDFANEHRTTFEVSFGIGLTFFGNLIANFSWLQLVVTLVFIIFGGFSYYRYWKKNSDMNISQALTTK
jgi:hypothetical protein